MESSVRTATKGKTGARSHRSWRRLLGHPEWVAGADAGLLAFVLYLLTLAPTVLYYTTEMKDAPALPVAAHVLGISHPTGYPTYTMLAHLFTYLPLGDVTYRVNLASAVFRALAVAALYAAALRLGRSVVAALVGALAFGASPLFWSQAVFAEVYTLHALFLALVLLVLLLWREKRRDGYLLLAAFVIGLSMTHHVTSGLLLPTACTFVLLVEPRKVLAWRLVAKGVGVFALALVPYAYLPIRASMDPLLHVVEDPSDWGGFWDLLTGGEFKTSMWAFGPRELPGRFFMYLDHLSGQFHWVVLLVAIVGALHTLMRDRTGFALLAVLFLGFLIYALEYEIEDVHYYFIPTYAILSLWASAGLAVLLREARTLTRGAPKLRTAAPIALSLLVLAAALWGLPKTYRQVDMSADYEGRRIVETVAENAAPDAIVSHPYAGRRTALCTLWSNFLDERRKGPYPRLAGGK